MKKEMIKYIDDLHDFDIKLQKLMSSLIFEKGVPAWMVSMILSKELYNLYRTSEYSLDKKEDTGSRGDNKNTE